MRWDEAATFQDYARASVGTITGTYNHPNNQIFYTLLTHFGLKVFGEGVAATRLVAFGAGVALIPAAYAAARQLYDAPAGLWAAALTATAAPLIDYSVNGRGYTLGALFVVLALWLGALLLERSRLWAWGAFVVCCVLAVYTLPTMAIGIAAVALWMGVNALSQRQWRLIAQLALALAAAGLLALLLYSAVLGQRGFDAVKPNPGDWHGIKALASGVFENWNRAAPHPLDWILAAGFVASLVGHRRIAKHPVPIAAATIAVLVGVILFAPIAPFVRSWLFLLPIYLIHAGAGLAWATRRIGVIAPAVAAIVLGATMLHAGLRSADVPPISDNDITPLLHKYAPQPTTVLFDRYVRAPVHYYYYERDGDDTFETGLIRGKDRKQGRLIVVVPRGVDPTETVYKAGGVAATTKPKLLVRREWIEFYDVPILPHFEGHRLHYAGPKDRPQ
jgi:dolichyl-phosphate-mannose-protein mannosyltransferase